MLYTVLRSFKFQTWRSTSTFRYVLRDWRGGKKEKTCIALLYQKQQCSELLAFDLHLRVETLQKNLKVNIREKSLVKHNKMVSYRKDLNNIMEEYSIVDWNKHFSHFSVFVSGDRNSKHTKIQLLLILIPLLLRKSGGFLLS